MSDVVQQIKDKLSILDVISPYVELHKAGKNFKGKSPFAAEKTPSFYVSPDRGMYYCFSTSQGGDMFTFIQVIEGVEFKEALKVLAEKAGVEIVPEDPKKKTERERWYAALKEATEFYSSKLRTQVEAQEYLRRRGVSTETIQKWQIGFAPGPPAHGWREVKEHLEARGYTRSELLAVGLIKTADAGKEPFDVFRDRIMFPMADSSGRIVAFSGRILSKDTDAPKYVNSPETDLYKKSELLFGYDKAKHGIRNLDFSLIVEGQFDVVMSHQAGYTNAVAVSGTALTLHHVQQLERLSTRVVLALDADRAGIAAMKRAADLMLRRGLDVKVAELPDGKDPADLILEGKEKFKTAVGKAVHIIEFLLHVLTRTVSDTRTLKLKAREEILPFILLLPNRIDQEHFIGVVAESIGTTTDAVRFEIDRLREAAPPPADSPVVPHAVQPTSGGLVSSIENAYVFLLAASELLEGRDKNTVLQHMSTITAEYSLADVNPSHVAAAVFTLEHTFEKMPELAKREEVLAKLNVLRDLITRHRLALLRQRLEVGDEDESIILRELSVTETARRAPPLTLEIFK